MNPRLTDETKQRLEKLGEGIGQSQSHLAVEAIKGCCNLQDWQLAAIQDGLDAANRGELVAHSTVKFQWEAKLKAAAILQATSSISE